MHNYKSIWNNCGGLFDVPQKKQRLAELEIKSAADNFWQNTREAKELLKEQDILKEKCGQYDVANRLVSDTQVLLQLGMEANDQQTLEEVRQKITEAKKFLGDLEFQRILSGPQDNANAFLQISAGAGGTESCDWAAILLRMFLRYAESRKFKADIVDATDGDGAGYRSVTVAIQGSHAYGLLKAEVGVHRLVRISPFDANKRRHTSFASVFVYPDIAEDTTIEVADADIRVDTFRAGGAGGQKVNKTDSAVRMTHLATGIVVQCQNERSQHQNRAMAMKILKARLYELEQEKKRASRDLVEASKKDNAWGSQIRSYVLQPYQMVKDHRTNYETAQTQKVLDGDLDEFIRRYLLEKK